MNAKPEYYSISFGVCLHIHHPEHPLRTLFLLDDLGMGGLQRHFLAAAAELQSRGHKVTVAVERYGPLMDRAVELHVDVMTWLEATNTELQSGSNSFDVVLTAGGDNSWSICERLSIPTLLFWWGDHRTEMFSWPSATRILACSERSAAAYSRLFPNTHAHVFTIDNPVTFLTSHPVIDAKTLKESIGIPHQAFVALSLGRFSRIKRYLRLIHEAHSFLTEHEDAYLVIAGSHGDARSGWTSTYEACKQFRDALPYAHHIILLENQLDPVPLLNACDVYVSMTESEGQSLAISEAVSLGKPVIATAVSGVCRQIEQPPMTNGIIVPVYGPSGLSSHLAAFHDSPEMRAAFGQKSMRLSKRFALSTHVTTLEQHFTEALSAEPLTAPLYLGPNRKRRLLIVTYESIRRVSPRLRAHYMRRCLEPFRVTTVVRIVDDLTIADIEWADLVVFHRVPHRLVFCTDHRDSRSRRKRILFLWELSLRAKPTLYDLDDYVFVPESDPHGLSEISCHMLSTATRVIANSQAAAKRFSKWSRRIDVIENPVDDLLWSNRVHQRVGNQFTVGWVAGSTHTADLEHAQAVIEAILSSESGIRAVVLGGNVPFVFGPADGRLCQLPTVSWHDVPAVLAEWDISLSPLILSEENHSKGHGHICEPGMLGIPSVAQRTDSYEELIVEGVNGFLADSPETWVEPVLKLYRDSQLCRSMGARIRDEVASRFGFLNIGRYYRDVIDSLS